MKTVNAESLNQIAKQSQDLIIVSDQNFVSGYPRSQNDIRQKLEQVQSPLLTLTIETDNNLYLPINEALAYIGEKYAISPSILLTLAENKFGVLSKTDKEEYDERIFSDWLRDTSYILYNGFYEFYQGNYQEYFLLPSGNNGLSLADNAATYALHKYYSKTYQGDSANWHETVNLMDHDFRLIYNSYFQNTLIGKLQAEHPSSEDLSALSLPFLKFPWEYNDTWNFTGGPHTFDGTGPLSGIDFQPVGVGGCNPNIITNRWIVASAAGKTVDYQSYWLKLDHDQDGNVNTGWLTVYGHIANRIGDNISVEMGQQLGNPSCLGGNAIGAHLHFGIKYQNVWQPIAGTVLSGWTVANGQVAYHGYLNKGGESRESCYKTNGSLICSSLTQFTSDNNGQGGGGTGLDCGQVSYPGVILYEHATCNKDQGGVTKAFSSATNWIDIVSDPIHDKTSSIYVASGWSIKVFEKATWDDNGGSWRCIDHSMWDLNLDYYTNGDTGRKINDDISSVQVYNNSTCSSGPPPGNDTVTIFTEPSYNGTQYGWHDPGTFNVPDYMNDQVSSIQILNGWSARVFEHANEGGGERCYNSSDSNFDGDTYDTGGSVNNSPTSIIVYNQENCPSLDPVIIYERNNLEGAKQSWTSAGSYNLNSQLDNFATSVRIRSGWSIRVFQDANKGGGQICFDSTDTDFGNNTYNNGAQVNDSISSIEIYQQENCPSIPSVPSLSSPGNGSNNPYNYDLNFQWNPSSGATEYLIEWWGGPYTTMQPCGWSSSTSCHIGVIAAGHTYYWHVKARNSAGESDWSDTWSFTIQNNQLPDLIVQSITASPANPTTNQPVTFTIRIKNQGTGNASSSFYVDFYIDDQPITDCSDTGVYWWTVPSLAAGATQDLVYNHSSGFSTSGTHNLHAFADTNCYISESNENNNILGPVAINVQNQSLPAPTLISPSNNATINRTSSVTLSWNSVSGATQYYAEFTGGPGTNINSGWISNTSWSLGSQWGGVYTWRVKARNSSGIESSWSEVRTLNIKSGTPSNLAASVVSSTQINLSWNASSDAPNNIDGYRIYRGGTAIATVPGGTTTYNNTGLTCATAYSFTVRAYKGSLESDASNTANATTQACPVLRPDLIPSPRPGRADPVIASSVPGTVTNSVLYVGQPTYFDWGYTNIGNADVNSNYYVDLYIDDQRIIHYPFTSMGVGGEGGFDDWSVTWNESGWHTVKLVVDAENNLVESNESNNVWTRDFYWEAAPPPNDDFNSPTIISTMPYNISLDTTGATQAGDDPDLVDCNRLAGLASVWYRYTPPANGTLNLDTKGSNYDTMLAVWTGSRGNLNPIGCNDDIGLVNGNWDQDSILTLNLSSGITYYIEVSTYNGDISVAETLELGKPEGISAQSGGGQLQFHANYIVPIPSAPALASPANGFVTTDYTPALDWNDQSPTPDHYQVQVATASSFTAVSILYDQNTTNSDYTIPSNLTPGKIYYWRVRAFNGLGQSSGWSSVRNFKTGWLPPSSLNSPNNGEQLLNKRPTFSWASVSGATSYNLQVSKNSNLSSPQINVNVNGTSYIHTADLTPNTLYYWSVRTNGTNGPSGWAPIRTFTTANPPGTPVLSSPANNALSTDYRPLFKWSVVTLPAGTTFDHYQIQVDDDPAFGSPAVNANVFTHTAPQFQPTSNLASNTKFYWRVRGYNTLGHYSAWSTSRYVRTAILPPVLNSPTNAAALLNKRPDFDWQDVAGASGYKIVISKNANLSSPVKSATTTGSFYSLTTDLPANTLLYWGVQATGTNGPSLYSTPRTFTTGNPPSVPSLTAPANNALLTTYQPKLDWGNSTVPAGTVFDHYQVQVATDSTFTNITLNQTTGVSEFTPTSPLNSNTTYFWRVRSFNTLGHYSAWSATRSFRAAITPPSLLSPSNGSGVGSLRPVFDWTDVSGATGYTIQVSASPNFSSLLVNASTVSSTYTATKNLPSGKTLYWRVRANGPNGPSAWSATLIFVTP